MGKKKKIKKLEQKLQEIQNEIISLKAERSCPDSVYIEKKISGFEDAGVKIRTKRELTEFGIRVKKALIDKKMTQAQLADRVGTSRQYITKILFGEKQSSKYVDRIKEVLDISA